MGVEWLRRERTRLAQAPSWCWLEAREGSSFSFLCLDFWCRQEAEQRKALLHRFPRRPREGQKCTWKEETESCDYVRVSVRFVPNCALWGSLGSMGLLGEVGLHFLAHQWQLSSVVFAPFFPLVPMMLPYASYVCELWLVGV